MLYLMTRKYIKTQYSIKTLLELLTSEAQPEFKQMAVILLQKAIFKHFQGLGEADTKILRDTILKIYFESKIPRVKSILANLLAKIAEYYFSNEKVWPEVLNEISKRSEDTSNPDSLMDAIILLTNMLDSCDEYLKASYAQISSFLENVLKLNKPELTVEVLKCLSYIVGSLDDDELCKQYGYLFQTVMSTFDTLNRPELDEDIYFIVVDLISSMAQEGSSILDPAKSKELLSYFLSEKGLKANYLNVNIKDSILNMMNLISNHKRTFFTKNKELVEKLMIILVEFMLGSKGFDHHDEDDAHLGFSSIRLFEILSENLPKKLTKPILKKLLGELYKSKEQKQLICMYFIYSAVANGMQDVLKPDLPKLMKEEIATGINHPSPAVKNAAIRTVSYFSEFLLPNILEYTSDVIPALVCAMDSDDIELVEHSVFVLDVFTEYLEEDQIKEYLPLLVPKVITMISHPKATYKIRKFSVDALCSLVNAGGDSFFPYLDQSYTILNEIIGTTNEEIKLVHSAAFSCMGKILTMVCAKDKSHFASKFLQSHNAVLDCIANQGNNFDLMEGCYVFMYQAVETLGEEYGKESLSKAFPHAKGMIEKESIVRKGSKDVLELDDEDEEEGNDFILVNLDEAKSAALHWLGSCAENSPFTFQPIEAEVGLLLDGCLTFTDKESPSLRQQSIVASKGILIGKIKRAHNGNLPPFRKGWDTPALSQEITEYFSSQYYMKIEFYISNEQDKENVCLVIEAFKDCLKLTGSAVLKNEMEHLVKLIDSISSFDLVCFDKGDDDEDDLESDGRIFMALVDLLVTISDILAKDSQDFLTKCMPGILSLVEKGNVFELDEFFGGYCDIIKNCPEIISKHTDIVLDMVYESPALQDAGPVRNACFLLGIMHETNPIATERFIQKSLGFYMNVHQTFTEPEVKDNVIAGIIRVYSVDKSGLVPEDKLIQTVLPSYPFTGDTDENQTFALFADVLLRKNPAAFAQNMDIIVKILLDLIVKADEYKTEDNMRQTIKSLITKLSSDPQGKAALEEASLSLDQAIIAKFLA